MVGFQRGGGGEQESPRSKNCWQGWPQDALEAVERMQTSGDEQQFQPDDRSNKKPRIHVDLPTEQSALPYNWEQFLDINTGEVYYIDWTTCKRTSCDPREAVRLAENKIRAIREDYLSRDQRLSSNSLTSTASGSFDTSSGSGSSSSDTLPTPPGRTRGGEGEEGSSQVDENEEEESCDDSSRHHVMVTGCRRCLTYCLVERHRPVCPSCGSHLQVMN